MTSLNFYQYIYSSFAHPEPELVKSDSGAVGVQLTLSRSIQRAAEAVAVQTMQSGCILVLDAASAKVRACASTPGFDPENVSEIGRAHV